MPPFRGAGAAPASSAFTYQAQLIVNPTIDASLTAYARLYGHAERCLFAATARGHGPDKIKPAFSRKHGLTARQFNAVSAGLTGKVASIKERHTSLIGGAAGRIKKALEVIKKLSKKIKQPGAINEVVADALALCADRVLRPNVCSPCIARRGAWPYLMPGMRRS